MPMSKSQLHVKPTATTYNQQSSSITRLQSHKATACKQQINRMARLQVHKATTYIQQNHTLATLHGHNVATCQPVHTRAKLQSRNATIHNLSSTRQHTELQSNKAPPYNQQCSSMPKLQSHNATACKQHINQIAKLQVHRATTYKQQNHTLATLHGHNVTTCQPGHTDKATKPQCHNAQPIINKAPH